MKKYGFGKRGWCLVIYGFLCMLLATAIPTTIQVALDMFIAKGFNPTHMLSLMTFGSLGTLVLLFILNFFTAKGKANLRKLSLVLGILWAVFTALFGVMPTQTTFTIVYILAFVCCQVMALIGVNNMVANWFPTRKGVVIGLVTIGFTLGAMVGLMVLGGVIMSAGLAVGYIVCGVLVLAVTLFGFFTLRDYPEEIGCFPDNDRSMTREKANEMLEEGRKMAELSPWSQKRVLGTWQMWSISICCGLMMLFSGAVTSQIVQRLTAAGYPQMMATLMFSAAAIIGCIGSWFIGFLDNKLGTKTSLFIMLIAMAVACVFTTLGVPALMFIALALIGVELGGSSNFSTSLVVRYWGRFNFPKVYGVVVLVQQIIGAFGALFASSTAAKWNYDVTYLIMAGLSVIALLVMIPVKDGFVAKREAMFTAEASKAE